MRTTLFGVSFLAVLGFAGPALAQPQVPGGGVQRPTVSPYVNLLRGNNNINNAALGYYGVVRPEQQFRQQAGQFQQQLSQTDQSLNNLSNANGQQAPVLITGKGASFNNLGGYFNSYGGGGMAGPGGTGGGGASFGAGAMGSGAGRNNSSGFTVGQAPAANTGRGGRRR